MAERREGVGGVKAVELTEERRRDDEGVGRPGGGAMERASERWAEKGKCDV